MKAFHACLSVSVSLGSVAYLLDNVFSVFFSHRVCGLLARSRGSNKLDKRCSVPADMYMNNRQSIQTKIYLMFRISPTLWIGRFKVQFHQHTVNVSCNLLLSQC